MPPRDRPIPNTAGFSGFWKSTELVNCSMNRLSTKRLYVLVALKDDENVPVIMPSKNFTLKPSTVSLKPSILPFNSVKRVSLLLGLPT